MASSFDNPNYSYISTINTPDGTSHYIKDAEARDAIDELKNQGVSYIGVSATALTDGSTASPINIYESGSSGTTKSVTPARGDFVIYKDGSKSLEFMWDGSSWGEFGSTGALKALAFKDDAGGSYDKATGVTVNSAGSTAQAISATFGGNSATVTSTGSYTPKGTCPAQTITPNDSKSSFVNAVTMSVSNETLAISVTSAQAVTATAPTASDSTLSGTPETISVDGTFTPSGTVSGSVDISHDHTASVVTTATSITVS